GEPVYPIPVDANLAREPETLIAHQAHHLAHYLCRGARVQTPPPGGEANWAQVTEVVAVFLGFGVMMANTAFVARRGGCGSCGVPVQRHSSLSQFDLTYALGLFSVLKGLPARAVLPGL
ncbi:MAG: hypothetical protein GWN58_20820, partial [Anaerolineae bacterium]|nr:hypothetical protein [Anaerolineae bacterium]